MEAFRQKMLALISSSYTCLNLDQEDILKAIMYIEKYDERVDYANRVFNIIENKVDGRSMVIRINYVRGVYSLTYEEYGKPYTEEFIKYRMNMATLFDPNLKVEVDVESPNDFFEAIRFRKSLHH